MLNYKLLASALSGLLLISCSNAGAKFIREQQQLRNSLLEQYQIVQDSYPLYLKKRFEIALSRSGTNQIAPTINLLTSRSNTSEVFALAINPEEVVISEALVANLENEAQLGFIVAHEIGHIALKHLENPARTSQERLEQELEADSFAVGLSALAGYDIRYAISAVLVQSEHYAPKASYPDPQERYRKLQQRILTSGWRPPGTVNRNDFMLFRARARIVR